MVIGAYFVRQKHLLTDEMKEQIVAPDIKKVEASLALIKSSVTSLSSSVAAVESSLNSTKGTLASIQSSMDHEKTKLKNLKHQVQGDLLRSQSNM